MSGAGEVVPYQGLQGEILGPGEPVPGPGGGRGGAVFDDVVSRLRGYVAPPPTGELGWQAAAGAGLTLTAAGLLALLPGGASVEGSGLLRWLGRSSLAGTLESATGFAGPLAVLTMFVLAGIVLIYATAWGATPALVFLTAQTWIGVLVLFGAVVVWLYLLFILVLNLVIWIGYITLWAIGVVIALRIIGFFLNS